MDGRRKDFGRMLGFGWMDVLDRETLASFLYTPSLFSAILFQFCSFPGFAKNCFCLLLPHFGIYVERYMMNGMYMSELEQTT